MAADRPKFSDDHLLAAICVLGNRASDVTACSALAERLGQGVERGYVAERLRRLHEAHLVAFGSSWRTDASSETAISVRLTAAGVERLRSLQREPMAPETT